MTSELERLLRRVEAAEGADQSLDKLIAKQVAGLCLHEHTTRNGPEGDIGYDCDDCGGDSWGNKGRTGQALYDPLPRYTASIDAAVALVEKMLPGWQVSMIGPWADRDPYASVRNNADIHGAAKPTLPIALICALLRALIARGEQ